MPVAVAHLLPYTAPFSGQDCPIYALHFAKRSIKVTLAGTTCYYPKLNVLAEAITANPKGPTGVTLRQSLCEAVEAAGGARPTQFVRY